MRFLLTIITCFTITTLPAQDTLRNKQADSLTMKLLNEVTVYASRIPEKILQSPVSVEKVNEAFFTINGRISLGVFLLVLLDKFV